MFLSNCGNKLGKKSVSLKQQKDMNVLFKKTVRHTHEVLDRLTDAVSVSTANKPHKIESGYSTKHQACCTEHQLETAGNTKTRSYDSSYFVYHKKIVQGEFIGER